MWRRKREFAEIEATIGYRFMDESLLKKALTHASFRFESEKTDEDNQRLEFLGDSVLGFVVALWLFNRDSDADEGELTKARSLLTNGKTLAEAGRQMNIGPWLRVGRGESLNGGTTRSSTIADAVEALIGAVYLDGGLDSAERTIKRILKTAFDATESLSDPWTDNPKGRLQDYAQRKWGALPSYRVVKTDGPPHETIFHVEVCIPDGRKAESHARTRKGAEVKAATLIIEQLSDQE